MKEADSRVHTSNVGRHQVKNIIYGGSWIFLVCQQIEVGPVKRFRVWTIALAESTEKCVGQKVAWGSCSSVQGFRLVEFFQRVLRPHVSLFSLPTN